MSIDHVLEQTGQIARHQLGLMQGQGSVLLASLLPQLAGVHAWRDSLMRELLRRGVVLMALCLVGLMIGPFQGVEGEVGVSDKFAHVAAFCLITAAVFLNWRAGSRLQIAGSVILIGVLVEIVQGLTGRDMELGDLVADAIGVLLTTVVWPRRKII